MINVEPARSCSSSASLAGRGHRRRAAARAPVVVIELVLGIVVGPQVLGLAESDDFIEFFSNLGLGMLFFFAGYEIEFERIRGEPLRLGAGLAAVAGARVRHRRRAGGRGIVLSFLYTGSALATTAIGTLIPILRDAGELRTRFGTYLLAAGAAGEFGPILLVTLVLSGQNPCTRPSILLAFVALAVVAGSVSVRRVARLAAARADARVQQPARGADRGGAGLRAGRARGELGLDVLLGGFVAGMIVTRLALGAARSRSSSRS